jgi:hypothetical protein
MRKLESIHVVAEGATEPRVKEAEVTFEFYEAVESKKVAFAYRSTLLCLNYNQNHNHDVCVYYLHALQLTYFDNDLWVFFSEMTQKVL